MTTLKFADTHNMVMFLAKPAESEGFEQIVDFLNAHTIKRSKRKDTEVADEAVNEEMDDSLVRAATTTSRLEAEQDSGNINKTQPKETLNEPSSPGTSSGSGPRRQETMWDIIAQTRSENVSKLSNDPLLTRVLNLETTKITQANEISSLKRRVKKLEKKNKSRNHKLKRLYKVGLSARVESSRDEESLGKDASKQGRRITDIDDDEGITLVNDQIDADAEKFDVDTLTGDEVLAEQVVAAKYVNLSVDEVTLAQALAALKSEKVQEKGDVIKEPSVPVSIGTTSTKDSVATTTIATIPTLRKGIVFQEPEPEKPMKKKELIRLDEEIASKLQAEFDEELRLAREKAKKEQEANVALTGEWDDIQAKIKADHELAQRLQAQEQEELSDAETATLFNMEEMKPKNLKNKSFDSIQKMFDKAFKRQKVDDDKETTKLKSPIEVIPDEEEVELDPLAVKSSSILVKAKYGSTRPVEDLDLVLYGDLKTMFEPHVEDNVWKNQSDYKVLDWKLYDLRGVHSMRKQNGRIVGIKRLLDDLGVTAAQVYVTAAKLKYKRQCCSLILAESDSFPHAHAQASKRNAPKKPRAEEEVKSKSINDEKTKEKREDRQTEGFIGVQNRKRLKEKEDQEKNMEDVFENEEGIAQIMTADNVRGLSKGVLNYLIAFGIR
ncbi:hypothetical protein Tco_1485674 [Tanacetum coccineum]